MIPLGDIEIMTGLSSQMENSDFQRKRFKGDYLNFLNNMKKMDSLHTQNDGNPNLMPLVAWGLELYSHTDLPSQTTPRREALSANYLVLRVLPARFRDIVRSSPYQSPLLPQSEEYRLVLGTYRCKGIPWFHAIFPEGKERRLQIPRSPQTQPLHKALSISDRRLG